MPCWQNIWLPNSSAANWRTSETHACPSSGFSSPQPLSASRSTARTSELGFSNVARRVPSPRTRLARLPGGLGASSPANRNAWIGCSLARCQPRLLAGAATCGVTDAVEQVRKGHARAIGKPPGAGDAHLAFSALDEADDSAVHAGIVGQLLLCESVLCAKVANPRAEGRQALQIQPLMPIGCHEAEIAAFP